MSFLINLLITGIAVAIAAYVTPGATVDGYPTAVIVGLVFAIVNATIGTLLRLLTLPFNILTLGLVSLVIWVLMVLLTDKLIDGFAVSGFLSALVFAVILSLVQMVLGGKQK